MRITGLLVSLLILALPLTASFAAYDEGIDYKRIARPMTTEDPSKVEVMELFWYGCPHCYRLEPHLNAWLKKQPKTVNFVRVPAVFNPGWAYHAKMYYTADLLGVLDKMHPAIFNAMHVKRKKLNSDSEVYALFKEFGVSEKDFNSTFNSFAVDSLVRKATDITRRSNISGVPSLVIDGKFVTDGPMGNGHEGMLRITDFLIQKEMKTKK
jgi:thiol:disulfide interchange protein DsbA